MIEVTLNANRREVGKQAVKRTRKNGLVPGVYYISGNDAIPIAANPLALRPFVYTSQSKLVNLILEGETEAKECFMKETIFDPVTDKVVHFDLVGVVRGQTMTVDIPIALKGQAVGVREGGMLQHILHRVKVECLPKDLPDSIEIDITNIGIGKSIAIKNLHIENVKFDLAPDTIIVSVVPPRVGRDEAPVAGAAAAAAATTAAAPTAAPAAAPAEKEKGKKGK